ncbi:MAG: SPFH domain-containing protein [Proteobacteria bacterium]|nr:SPFH domain-containing protein [Pseudomonadota bacterium]
MTGVILGFLAWFVVRCLLNGFYSVEQNERAVKTVWGRAERLEERGSPPDPALSPDEAERYAYPRVRVIPPGGPYFRWPWESVYKASVATETVSLGYDPENPSANRGGQILEAVTKDQLNTELSGQIRFTVSESNLYAFLFGIKNPRAHIMGYIHAVLRERIANFESPQADDDNIGAISINDLRKNLRLLNEHMEHETSVSEARYGIKLNAALVTGIDPPDDVESALAAINTAHNQVSSEISLARAAADQKIVQSRRAVEIETLKAQAEVEPLRAMADQLEGLQQSGPNAVPNYVRNLRLGLIEKAGRVVLEVES